ncbi:MAG: M1 family metallopeptidase [Candidatus Bipolaricaulota bacterium]|nr:M1 family metallopeptidase [Candidatus Bipolaricaulota bacterium]
MARPVLGARVVSLLALLVLWVSASTFAETHYILSLDVDYNSGTYEGTLAVTYGNPAPEPLAELFFRLYPNAATLYSGSSVEILDARVGDTPVETALYVDDTVLMVPLPKPLPPTQTTSVTLTFRGRASLRLDANPPVTHEYGILTKTPYALVLTSFYPLLAPYLDEGWALDPVGGIGDALFSEASSYDVTVRVDRLPTPIASGFLVDAVQDGDAVIYRFAADHARDFSLVLVSDGRIPRRASVDDLSVRVWFGPDHATAANRALEKARAAVTLYQGLIGPLPYDEIDIVEVPLQHIGGVELTGLVLLSETYTTDPYDLFFDILVSHELAHEWFYAAVGNDPVETPWLDEGLATYLSNVFLAEADSPDIAAGERDRWARSAELARSAHPEIPVTAPLYDFPDSSTYSALAYSGVAFELGAIRERIGDDAFFAALSDYYRTSLFSIATPLDLRRSFEAACGCAIDGALFPGTGTP